jgi:hypothetical protein
MTDIDPFEVLSMQADIIKEDLDKMLMDKTIGEDEYNKNISALAYEYAINGFPDDCILMLLSLKGDYFQGDGIRHFKEDEAFFSKCYVMFEVLSFVGHVPPDAFCTQATAKA